MKSWFSHFCSNLLLWLRGCHQTAIPLSHSLISLSFQGPCDWIILYTLLLSIMAVTTDSPPLFIIANICLHPATADCGPAPLEDKYPYQTKEEMQPATTSLSRAWSWCLWTFCYQPILKLWPWVCIESEGSMNTQRWYSQARGIDAQFLVKCTRSNICIFLFS